MNQPTSRTESKPTRVDASPQPRPVRAAALLSAVPTLSALVLVVAMSGPKLPPMTGD